MITVLSTNGSVIHLKIGMRTPNIINRIVSLTADGEELEKIKRDFINLVYPKTDRVVWKGDMARFIYDHL
jgi:hypothetical protein